jgi:hypothetical protein
MGDAAEMILDGIIDGETGEYIGYGVGYPRTKNNVVNRSKVHKFKDNHLPHIKSLYSVNEFNTNSFRIKGNGFTVDYYPKSEKLFNHADKVWHTGVKSALKFINKHFKTEVAQVVEAKVVPIQNEEKRTYLEWIIKRGNEIKEELKTTFDRELKKDLTERLENLKNIYIKENTPTT